VNGGTRDDRGPLQTLEIDGGVFRLWNLQGPNRRPHGNYGIPAKPSKGYVLDSTYPNL